MLDRAERLGLILDRKNREKIKNRLNLSKLGNWLAVISAILILIFTRVSYKYWLIGALAILIIINSFSRYRFNKQNGIYTKEGVIKAEQIIGFAKMLNEIGSFKKKDLPELPLWEDIMPYAVGLGLSKKILKKLKIYFPSETDVDTSVRLSNWYYSGVYDFERGVNDTAYDAEVNNSGSDYTSSDFGSDFSSGDSGGSDGDSGFGAF